MTGWTDEQLEEFRQVSQQLADKSEELRRLAYDFKPRQKLADTLKTLDEVEQAGGPNRDEFVRALRTGVAYLEHLIDEIKQ